MTDEELLDYFWWHSRTPLHLFHVQHIDRLLSLAGEESPDHGLTGKWYGVPREVAEPLVIAARARLKAKAAQDKSPSAD